MDNWNWNLDELVDKVMSDLRNGGVVADESSVSAALTRDFRSVRSRMVKEEKKQEPSTFNSLTNGDLDAKERANDIFTLSERVIFAEIICKRASQTTSKRWKIYSGAIVTPSAKDELKKRGIELFFVDGGVEASRKENNFGSDKLSQGSRVTLSASNVRDERQVMPQGVKEKNSGQVPVFLVNHLPEAERFPSNVREYLSRNSSFTEVVFSCLKEASRKIQEESQKNKALKTVLATHDSAVASVWCNRLSGIRAVVAFSYEQVCLDLEAANANVVIIDPSRVGVYQFRRIVDYYLRLETKQARYENCTDDR